MDSNQRLEFLYFKQEEPGYPGFSTPRRVVSPLTIERPPLPRRQPTYSARSPTLSQSSTVSSHSSMRTDSTRRSSGSSAPSTTAPPWQPLQDLNQQLAMTPYNYGYDLPCEFELIGCHLRFHPGHFEDWISHSTSHFGRLPPPHKAICTICDENMGTFQTQGDPYANWRERMIHIGAHFQNLEGDKRIRPDFGVLKYMMLNRLIDEQDYNYAIRYSERPYCDGLVARIQSTSQMVDVDDRKLMQGHNLEKERREMQKGHRKEGRRHRGTRK